MGKMASKIIFDSPDLVHETLVSRTKACKEFPVTCSLSALERWWRHGSRGVVLESVLICGNRYTSKEAIARFIRGQLRVEAERPAPTRGMTKKDAEAAARRFGLPEPQGSRKDTNIQGFSAKRQES
jgi:hypothetical protein